MEAEQSWFSVFQSESDETGGKESFEKADQTYCVAYKRTGKTGDNAPKQLEGMLEAAVAENSRVKHIAPN